MKQLTNRVQKLSVGVIAVIFVAAFFVSAIPAESVFAAKVPANDSSTNPDDWLPKTRATRWAQLTGLYHCVQSAWSGANSWQDTDNWLDRNHKKVSDAHAASGEWFWDPTLAQDRVNEAAGYIDIQTKDNGNGKADCDLVVQAVMKTYSISGIDLMCKLGGKREDGSDCTKSGTKATFDPPSSGARMDVSSVWGSKDLPSNAGGAAYYELNLAALMNKLGCNLQEKAGATGNFAYTLKVLDSSGKLVDKTYTGQSRDHKINVYTSYPGINNQERSCGTIASDLNKYSGDYALWFSIHEAPTTSSAGTDGTGGTAEPTTCAVDGIGWIVCPVMNLMAKVNDSAFSFLTQFLTIRPALLTNDGTQNAWSAFRDIANVAFVIAFLVIVYSQLTSAGVSNYGIKKMLPRIVVAAILVNVSYYVCELAVDVSNIVGSSIYSLLKESINIGGNISNATWESKTVGILAGAGAVGGIVLLALLVIMAPTSLLAFVVIILILVARQAFVILLVVMSPLAFVAYLLPNTESWFKKWWKSFMAVLMVYPIVGVVFGASTLASNILSSAAANTNDASILQLVALGVLAVPLFAVPALLKGSLSAAGAVGQTLAGLQDRANRRGLRSIKEGRIGEAKAAWDRSRQNNRFKRRTGNGRLATWGKDREGVVGKSAAWIGTRQQAFDSSRVGAKLGGTRGAAVATQGIFKQYDEDVAAFKTTMSGKSNEALIEMIKNSSLSSEQRAAAAGMIMSRDHRESHLEALHAVGQAARVAEASNNTSELGTLSDIQKQMSHDMKDKPWALGDQAAGQLEEGVYGRSVNHDGKSQQQFGDIDEEIKDRVGKKLSAASIAKMNPDEMNHIRDAALNNELNDTQLKKLKTSIEAARANPQMNDLIKSQEAEKHQAILDYIAKNHPNVAADTQPTTSSTPAPPAQGGSPTSSTPPTSGGASPVPPIDPDDNAGVL